MEIILIRHGKPESADNPVLSPVGYIKWLKRYHHSEVAFDSRPSKINHQFNGIYTLSSDLTRAQHSAEIYQEKLPDKVNKLYREMEVPRYKLAIKLRAWQWVFLARVLWMAGLKGRFESFKQAKLRAELAADTLIDEALQHGMVILFGHGYMNRYIRISLKRRGWFISEKSNSFWGVTRLQYR